jgi:hypothetical protein
LGTGVAQVTVTGALGATMFIEPMGILLLAMLALLALVALTSLAVTFLALVACGVAPVLAAAAARVRRWMWRDWHPSTEWVPEPVAPRPAPARPPAVALVADHAGDADVELVTAPLPTSGGEAAAETLTAVHARLAPTAALELPYANADMLVCVLCGHGTVGPERRHVDAGQLAVVAPGRPVTVVADGAAGGGPADGQPAMEVLVTEMAQAMPRLTVTRDTAVPAPRTRRERRRPLRPVAATYDGGHVCTD